MCARACVRACGVCVCVCVVCVCVWRVCVCVCGVCVVIYGSLCSCTHCAQDVMGHTGGVN